MVKWSYTPRVQIVGRAARNPEAITAGMARISRDPTPVPQLIKEARDNTALARQRNQRVVYEFGQWAQKSGMQPKTAAKQEDTGP